MPAPRCLGVNPPLAVGIVVASCSHQDFATPRTTTPPSGVSVCSESGRTHCNHGAAPFRQHTEVYRYFESASIQVKGGWKETRGVQRPISAETPVSESRMASLNPFETKRKKAPQGTSSRVCDVQVAEEVGFEPARRFRLAAWSFAVQTKDQGPRSHNRPPLNQNPWSTNI